MPTLDPAYQTDPWPAFRFKFEVDGKEIGTFSEVSGLSVEVDVDQVEEGGENHFVHKLPGRLTWPNITLKRGITLNDNLFAWIMESSGNGFAGKKDKLERRDAEVFLLAPDGNTVRSWKLADAFAVRWTGPSFDASSTDAATEELEIAHHGFTSGDS